jgi:oligopeptide/dipeptide ABC transporter ATP-binding protein
MQPLIQVRDLTVCYRSDAERSHRALDGLNLDIAAGETVGLLGESGCGKTTLGLSLLGLLAPGGRVVRGTAFFRRTDLFALGERELQRIRGAEISMVYQEPALALNPVKRVGSQIAEVVRAHSRMAGSRAKDEAKILLEQVGLGRDSGIDQAYPHQLSGGQRQRVVIAQAIACRPSLIIADEPTTALDATTRTEILTLLKMLQTKLPMALLLISHDHGDLEQIVDRILVMYAGRLAEEGPGREVMQKPLHPYTLSLLRARPAGSGKNHRRRLNVIPGETPNLVDVPSGCAFEARCPDRREICRTCKPEAFQPQPSRRVACFNYAH